MANLKRLFKKLVSSTIYDIAKDNSEKFNNRTTKEIIKSLNEKIEEESYNGETSARIYYNKMFKNINNEILKEVEKHYKNLGFDVHIDFVKVGEKDTFNTIDVYW